MRWFIICCLLSVNWNVLSQENRLLTPNQMKEDFDYYLKMLYENHPNPYFFYSMPEFENHMSTIYARLNKPMTWIRFFWTVSEVNAYVDPHSRVAIPAFPPFTINNNESLFIMPNVRIANHKVYLKEKMGEKGMEIEEINGVNASEMVSEIEKYINVQLPIEIRDNLSEKEFCPIVMNKLDGIRSPFRIKFAGSQNIEISKGLPLRNYYEQSVSCTFRGGEMSFFKIYPFSSIAILTIQNFLNTERDDYKKVFEVFLRKVNELKIKYIFYDLTQNGGGQFTTLWDFGMQTLNVIKHSDVYLKVKETKRMGNGNSRYKTERMVLSSNQDSDIPEDRKLFVLQGTNTTSCGDYFCRIVAENKLGLLIGQNTGEPTISFTYANNYTMPNSKIPFLVATTLYDFSEYFDTETLHPDVYWDVNNTHTFTEEELMKIVEHCQMIKP